MKAQRSNLRGLKGAVCIGQGYYSHALKTYRKINRIYEFNGKAYARDTKGWEADYEPLTGELAGYVRVNAHKHGGEYSSFEQSVSNRHELLNPIERTQRFYSLVIHYKAPEGSTSNFSLSRGLIAEILAVRMGLDHLMYAPPKVLYEAFEKEYPQVVEVHLLNIKLPYYAIQRNSEQYFIEKLVTLPV